MKIKKLLVFALVAVVGFVPASAQNQENVTTSGVTITWSSPSDSQVVTVRPQIQWVQQAQKKETMVTVDVDTKAVTTTTTTITTETPAITWGRGPSVTVYKAPEVAAQPPQKQILVVRRSNYPWDQLPFIPIPSVSGDQTTTYVAVPDSVPASTYIVERPTPIVTPPVLLERGPYYYDSGYVPYYGSQGYALFNYPFLGMGLSASFDFRGGGGYYPPYWEVGNRHTEHRHINNTWRNYTGHGQGGHRGGHYSGHYGGHHSAHQDGHHGGNHR